MQMVREIALITSSNPVEGSIFSIRSSGNSARLWVGQELTSMGENKLACGYTGAQGEENIIGRYRHVFTSAGALIGGQCNIDNAFINSAQITTLTGQALTSISNEIATKQDILDSLTDITVKSITCDKITSGIYENLPTSLELSAILKSDGGPNLTFDNGEESSRILLTSKDAKSTSRRHKHSSKVYHSIYCHRRQTGQIYNNNRHRS